MLTLEQFRATRREVADLEKAGVGTDFWDAKGNLIVKPGYLYEGNLYIEREPDGSLSMTILQDSYWVAADKLEELEKILYQFGVDEESFS